MHHGRWGRIFKLYILILILILKYIYFKITQLLIRMNTIIDYCDECGGVCDGVHSITPSKTADEIAQQLFDIITSHSQSIIEKVKHKLDRMHIPLPTGL